MENFDFIHLSKFDDNEKYTKKGFNRISNISFDSLGLAILIGYLHQVINTKEYQYGLQLFSSIKPLQHPDSFTALKSALYLISRNFDIPSSLLNLYSGRVASDLITLASSYFKQDSLLSIQRSLRKFSFECNARIFVYYNDQIIEFNLGNLPRKIVLGVSIEGITKIILLLFENEPKAEIEFKYSDVLMKMIKKSCEVIKSSEIKTNFNNRFEKFQGIVPDFVFDKLIELKENDKKNKLLLKPAPKLGCIGDSTKNIKDLKKIIPLDCEETQKFLDRFMKKNSKYLRKKVTKIEKKISSPEAESEEEVKVSRQPEIDLKRLHKIINKPSPSPFLKLLNSDEDSQSSDDSDSEFLSNSLKKLLKNAGRSASRFFKKSYSSILKKKTHDCSKCNNEPILTLDLLHECILCEYCYQKSISRKKCLRCQKKYTEVELSELSLYFP